MCVPAASTTALPTAIVNNSRFTTDCAAPGNLIGRPALTSFAFCKLHRVDEYGHVPHGVAAVDAGINSGRNTQTTASGEF